MTFWFGVTVFALGILLSVVLHEAGHLITAKKFGMKATQFFAGFGPTLFSFRRGETEYGLKAIPAGGFVKIVGMTPTEENIAAEDMHRAFWRKPVWQRTIVLSAGSATHFVLGLLIFYLAAVTTGLPNAAAEEFDALKAPPVIGEVSQCVIPDYTIVTKDGQKTLRDCRASDPVAPAKAAGLRKGDRFESVGDTAVSTYGDFVKAIRAREPGPVEVTYVRGTERRTATVDLVATQRPPLGAEDDTKLETVSAIGVSVALPNLVNDYDLVSGVGGAFSYTGHMVKRTFQAIGKFPSKVPKLIDAIQGEKRDLETPISVVGASRIGGEAAELKLTIVFLTALAGLNIFIGVFNLFPLLPLDGGHIAIIWFERVRTWLALRRGRPDPGRVDYNKLMPVTLVVIVLFGGLTVLTLAADIINPISLRQ